MKLEWVTVVRLIERLSIDTAIPSPSALNWPNTADTFVTLMVSVKCLKRTDTLRWQNKVEVDLRDIKFFLDLTMESS